MILGQPADSYPLPVFSDISSQTHLADVGNDPIQVLKDTANIQVLALFAANESLRKLSFLNENWDGFGSARPDPIAIRNAQGWIQTLYQSALSTGLSWKQPNITASEEGDVVFEWWKGTHKLTLYVGPQRLDYVQVWGPDILREMADGELVGDRFQDLWRWLYA